MPRLQKPGGNVTKAPEKEKENLVKEYKFLSALTQLGLNNLLEKVKTKELILQAKDLQILLEMKKSSASEDLDNAHYHFKSCNSCIFDKTCTLYTPGAECKFALGTEIKHPKDAVEMMKRLLTIQQDRLMRGLLIEKTSGNGIDTDVSNEILNYFEMASQLKQVMESSASVTITAKGGPGILSQIFSDLIPAPAHQAPVEKVVETEAVPVSTEPGSTSENA
jgi:hypothetical protein